MYPLSFETTDIGIIIGSVGRRPHARFPQIL